ncbi:aminodeoxychorismate lyase [Klebsiella aerogenes]|nr:aminodeoxychorismate lyase [Klebsiella aerogenes]
MFLINGVEQDTLAANDRAAQFGDGCFTTAASSRGRLRYWTPICSVCRQPVKNYKYHFTTG